MTLVRTTVGRNVAGTYGGGLSVCRLLSVVLTVKDSTVRRNVAGERRRRHLAPARRR